MEKAPCYDSLFRVNRSVDETLKHLKYLKKRSDVHAHPTVERMILSLEEQRAAVSADVTESLTKRERNDEQRLSTQLRDLQ